MSNVRIVFQRWIMSEATIQLYIIMSCGFYEVYGYNLRVVSFCVVSERGKLKRGERDGWLGPLLMDCLRR
jgi:hypothetical protein